MEALFQRLNPHQHPHHPHHRRLGQVPPHPIHLVPSEPEPKCDAIAQVPASTRSSCTSEFAWADEFAHEEAQQKQYRRARAPAQSMCRHDGPARDEKRASAATSTSRGTELGEFRRALFYVCGSLLLPHLACDGQGFRGSQSLSAWLTKTSPRCPGSLF